MDALAQKEGNHTAGNNTAGNHDVEHFIAQCETNGKAGLQKSEIIACIKKMEPERDIKEITADVEEHFSHIDTNGDGALNKEEIEAMDEEDSDSDEHEH